MACGHAIKPISSKGLFVEEQAFRIIVIDDNAAIHEDFIKILKQQDLSEINKLSVKMFGKTESGKAEDNLLPIFEIDTATQGQEGVERIREALNAGKPYSLAFVDIRMPPGWDGIETIKHIWEIDKEIQVVICTAYSDYSWEETVAHLGKTDNLLVLKKPFDNVSVRQLACALTKKWQLSKNTHKYMELLQQKVRERTDSLQKSLSLVKATLESSDEGIVVIDDKGKILDFNQRFLAMWHIDEEMIKEFNENSFIELMKAQLKNADELIEWLQAVHKTADSMRIDQICFKDGTIFDCYAQPQILDNRIIARVLNFRDITERTQLENELQFQATHDALTGLPNRVKLLEKMHNSITEANSKKHGFSIIFIDLDRFKLINDSLSHLAGDELLKLTAERLRLFVRRNDLLARLGGDEFVIIMDEIHDKSVIFARANELVGLFQTPFAVEGRQIIMTASIGICNYPEDGATVETLLRNADAAMYHAKELGANNFQFYSPEMSAKNLEKLDREMELYNAIQNEEFVLYYQPQFDLDTEKLIAVEALLRWHHPEKGMLLPLDFILLAEETGLIIPIGEWVLRKACQQLKAWQDLGLPHIRMAVNITAQQLKQNNIIDVIKSILDETGLKAEYLELELTENIIISSMEAVRTITELKKLGLTIAIDDFGTGYSSLSYLKKLPLDRLKIDSSFIQHIKMDGDDEVIIRAIIAIAKNLNLEVLAEGVETKKQLKFLKSHKCNEIQGFLFSKPLTANELETMLSHPDMKDDLKDLS